MTGVSNTNYAKEKRDREELNQQSKTWIKA
jgi:hypothetical protein